MKVSGSEVRAAIPDAHLLMAALTGPESMVNWLEILRTAAMARHGIVIAVSDPTAAKQHLYRVKANDPSLSGLQLRTSPDKPDSEIWIMKARPNGS